MVGNSGRLLDFRRTPIKLVGVDLEAGFFIVEILDFEDRGARWEIPLERVKNYQFERGSKLATEAQVRGFEELVKKYDRQLVIERDLERLPSTQAKLEQSFRQAQDWLDIHSVFLKEEGRLQLDAVTGPESLGKDLFGFLEEQGVAELETLFTQNFVSNPGSGDLVKAYRIALAELGLVRYQGPVPRATLAFGADALHHHLVQRLGFVRALFDRVGIQQLVLYRGLAGPPPLRPHPNHTFVSTSLRREVAESLFQAHSGSDIAVLYRQSVPVERVFMSFFETQALNSVYLESEVVLLYQAGNLAF